MKKTKICPRNAGRTVRSMVALLLCLSLLLAMPGFAGLSVSATASAVSQEAEDGLLVGIQEAGNGFFQKIIPYNQFSGGFLC